MAGTIHEFDPDGDVILVLKNPSTDFAVWDDSKDYPLPYSTPPTPATPGAPSPISSPASPQRSPSEPIELAIHAASKNHTQPAASGEAPSKDDVIHMRVSSSHLSLASSYFKAMLRGGWEEGQDLRRDGFLRVCEEGWDPEALTIVMNIIHGHFRDVPREVSLEMLAKVIVIADYFKCVEIIEPFSERWIDHLGVHLSQMKDLRNIVLWVWISWTLRLSEKFELATFLASKYSRGPLQTLGLPIPEKIIGR
ncbi:hypothetical protein VTN77DRAFT_551 [Rasamsonia byssochlamydoides]|uniref:uncharacterized protein n=1 Tax=Rasamsonia byssochlamydoides TaxID=89139 RepID=UPI003742B046